MIKANLLVLERNLVKVKVHPISVEGIPIIHGGCAHYSQRVYPIFAEGVPASNNSLSKRRKHDYPVNFLSGVYSICSKIMNYLH